MPVMTSVPVRWRFFSVIFLLSFVSYLMRQNIHVAGEFMMPELGISEIEMGWIFASFIWGYALFQIPGGIAGAKFGPRRTLAGIGLVWILVSALTGMLPGTIATTTGGTIFVLVMLRFILGAAHAPIYPVQASAVQRWFPVGQWALPNAVSSSALTLGAAMAQPLVALIMVYWGWRTSFYVFVPAGIAAFALWWWYARDYPSEHPAMTPGELETISANRAGLTPEVGISAWRLLLRDPETIKLTLAYFAQCYVFYLFFTWFFHYLVKELGFSILETGFLAALPWMTGAVMATLGGWVCDRLCRRYGARLGCRIPAMFGLSASGVLLYVGLYAPNPYVAVCLLSLCFAGTQFAEGAFWCAQTYVAGPYTAPACGLMNTGGNLAGIVVAPLMPYLALHFGWVVALSTGSAMALLGVLLWAFIKADRPFTPVAH